MHLLALKVLKTKTIRRRYNGLPTTFSGRGREQMYKNLLGATALISVVIAGFIFKSSFNETRSEAAADYASAPLSIRSNITFNPTEAPSAPLHVVNVTPTSTRTVAPENASVDQMMAIILNELRNDTNKNTAPTLGADSGNNQTVASLNQEQSDVNESSTPLDGEDLLQALVNRSLVSANVSDISRTALSQTSLENAKRHKVKRGESLATIAVKVLRKQKPLQSHFRGQQSQAKIT